MTGALRLVLTMNLLVSLADPLRYRQAQIVLGHAGIHLNSKEDCLRGKTFPCLLRGVSLRFLS